MNTIEAAAQAKRGLPDRADVLAALKEMVDGDRFREIHQIGGR
jgi:hypothetical protein